MRAAASTTNGRVRAQQFEPLSAVPHTTEKLPLAGAFAGTVLRYLAEIMPHVNRELARWRSVASTIPSPGLRRSAHGALDKRGNIEGAALFATLTPAAHRPAAVRALVSFQAAYNYLDALSELPSRKPIENADRLHQALLAALCPGAAHPDYYAHNPDRDDGGYLRLILERCRDALTTLPSYPAMAPTARQAAARIVDFQALNLNERQGGHGGLERWAADATPAGSGLAWWETAAACGSSLSVHALLAASALPHRGASHAREIDGAYFPSIGALHSLLDSLVDRREDQALQQRSLLANYRSPADAQLHLLALAVRARQAVEQLEDPLAHRVIVTAMCSYYLSAPESCTPEAKAVTRNLTDVFGPSLSAAIVMFRARRILQTVTHGSYT